jgi:lipoprotein-anchoring transpeptidase ErfK/SrfK
MLGAQALWPLRAAADELILDNNAPFVQVTGPWTSTATTIGYAGGDYLFRTAGAGNATVFWPFPAAAPAGHYDVSVRWTSGPNRASDAQYFVSSGAGTAAMTRDQQAGGGVWQSLGAFDFQTGQNQGVTLTDRANGVVVADAVRFVGPTGPTAAPAAPVVSATPVPPAPSAAPPAGGDAAPRADANAPWTVTLAATDLHAGPAPSTDVLASVPQFSYLQILGYDGDWAYVFNPRGRGTAYTPSMGLGPSDAPPTWVTAGAPPSAASVELPGRTVGAAPVAFYPVDDKFAYTRNLGHNTPIVVHDRVTGADGKTWYRVDQGYLAAASVRLPRPPDRRLTGRWIDADLTEPAMLTAYEGDRIVRTALAIKGKVTDQTPLGVFTIGRRVADETMDSGTLGVPANSPGGYHLEHVLYTQYFTSDGASIHYNYWSSNFGYSGSHGCLGLNLADSEWMWGWATIGTSLVIHN